MTLGNDERYPDRMELEHLGFWNVASKRSVDEVGSAKPMGLYSLVVIGTSALPLRHCPCRNTHPFLCFPGSTVPMED